MTDANGNHCATEKSPGHKPGLTSLGKAELSAMHDDCLTQIMPSDDDIHATAWPLIV